ncbi:MAG: DNA adenine methylase [Tepidisphaeraceae bacterium]
MIRSPVKWHGGKRYLATRIIGFFPDHRIYLEPFGGGASVLLNKPVAEVETYNDLDLRISRLFRVLRNQGDAFVARARLVPYSQVEFDSAAACTEDASELDRAICDFVRWRQSFGGKGQSWSCTTGRARGGMAGDVNAWWTAIEQLPAVIDRLKRVQIICQSAFDAIPKFDHKDAVIYCDPPYVHSTRVDRAVYHAEMTDKEHRELGRLLGRCKGNVIVSGYPSGLYDDIYKGWYRTEFDIANHAAGGKTKKRETECLWMNFRP